MRFLGRRPPTTLAAGLLALSAAAATVVTTGGTAQADSEHGRAPRIGHVWTIILENKSYEATFTGLNQNSYLWKTLPSYGELLTQYYGTGHFSLDNYVSLVSGQAPAPDNQADFALTAVGPDQATATAGGTATIVVHGTFQDGAAQISMQQDGHLVTMWDFNIELD